MDNKLNIAIAGLGTVGSGLVKIIESSGELLRLRSGRDINIVAVSARDKHKKRAFDISQYEFHENPVALSELKNVDVVVELIGGDSGSAYDLCVNSLKKGKHVVTANKALMAKHGVKLAKLAEENNVTLRFEAAVAGGIPIIKTLKEGLSGNKIISVSGIMNGTCNFILTKMEETGRDFADILKEAQELGYAEADPTFDVDGIDTAHKLVILTSLAFSNKVNIENTYIEGIRNITPTDILHCLELGYRIKLLGSCFMINDKLIQTVFPALVNKDSALAQVRGVNNAVSVKGSEVGELTLQGPGAGSAATASSVIADIVDAAMGRGSYTFNIASDLLSDGDFASIDDYKGEYYICVTALDKKGVLADVTDVLRKMDISMQSIIQKASKEGESTDIAGITHITCETTLTKAVEKISKLDNVIGIPKFIRVVG